MDKDGHEPEPDRRDPRACPRWLRSAFAYRSPQLLRVSEPRLGALYWAVVLTVLAAGLFAMFSGGLHQQHVLGAGTIWARVEGKAFVGSRGYDPADLALGAQALDGVFIATRIVTQRGQELGHCIDYDQPCPCARGQNCIGGFCEGTSWCPSLGDGNIRGPPPGAPVEAGTDPTVERFEGLEKLTLSLTAGIMFPGVDDHFLVAGRTPGARNPFGNLTLGELLAQANEPIKLEGLRDFGAIIGVHFFWSCEFPIADSCEPSALVQRLDGGGGYHQKHARRYPVGGKEQRDAAYAFGLKIHVTSSGEGRRVSLWLFTLQVASVLALLRLAPIVADMVLWYAYPEDYHRQKVTVSSAGAASNAGPPVLEQIHDDDMPKNRGRVDFSMGPAFGGVQSVLWPRHVAESGHGYAHSWHGNPEI